MRKILFEKVARKDFEKVRKTDLSTAKKIALLIQELKTNPESGTGRPEQLRGNLAGYWSRRINKKDRLVYSFDDEVVTVISVRGHYGDK